MSSTVNHGRCQLFTNRRQFYTYLFLLLEVFMIIFADGVVSAPAPPSIDGDDQMLYKYIADRDATFVQSGDIICNCSDVGCDSLLIDQFGSLFKGLCRSDGLCMKVVEKLDNDVEHFSYQCVMKDNMEPRGVLPFICLEHKLLTHMRKRTCCNTSLCNGHVNITLDPIPTIATNIVPINEYGSDATSWITLIAVVLVCLLMLFILVAYMIFRFSSLLNICPVNKPIGTIGETVNSSSKQPLMADIDTTRKIINDLFEDSGSGMGNPLLIRRTIANQIALKETIGQGRFGEVIRGVWKGDQVAVKIFVTRDETAYFREVDIYLTTMMRHPNILHFIGADNKDTGQVTQLWLITEYHPHGALLDYLTANTISIMELCRMVRSLCNGLAFLHSTIDGILHSKPAIAHRDLKSKNVLVKIDGQLCIADLGLAVRYKDGVLDMSVNNKAGTVRYLPPELLDESMPIKFDAFRAADVYAMGLIVWEMVTRTRIDNIGTIDAIEYECSSYELPYFEYGVPTNPTLEEMRKVVVVDGLRPTVSSAHDRHPAIGDICHAMRECWATNPNSRNQALVVRNTIDRIAVQNHLSLF